MRHEHINLRSPAAIAVEAAGFAFLAWKLKQRHDSRHDKPDAGEPQPVPLNAYDEEGQVYLYPGYDGQFEAGAIHPTEGYIEVRGVRTVNEAGEDVIAIDEAASEKDPNRLQILHDGFKRLYAEFSERAKS